MDLSESYTNCVIFLYMFNYLLRSLGIILIVFNVNVLMYSLLYQILLNGALLIYSSSAL